MYVNERNLISSIRTKRKKLVEVVKELGLLSL